MADKEHPQAHRTVERGEGGLAGGRVGKLDKAVAGLEGDVHDGAVGRGEVVQSIERHRRPKAAHEQAHLGGVLRCPDNGPKPRSQ